MTRPVQTPSTAAAAVLALEVDRRKNEPLHAQLGQQLRRMILEGRIGRGVRLPSSRSLAVDLNISRATVVLAYDQLASEGYLEGRQGAGAFVSSSLPEQMLQVARPAVAPSPRKPAPAAMAQPEPSRPFQLGAADPQLFPYRDWARLLARVWRNPRRDLTGPMNPFGWADLRAAIAVHLREWRGIDCPAARIVITSGTADAVDILTHAAFQRGDGVWMEEPGYPSLRYALVNAGIATTPVPVDAGGFDVELALRLAPAARGAIVTPSRQFPLGPVLPLSRRLALLDWAASSQAWIIEDDFDSEYRYSGAPLPALTSLDRSDRTIYIGSFSKVLSPSLRLGFIVLPEQLVEPTTLHLRRRGAMASIVAQPVLAEFMATGAYATHIRRTRRIYAKRMAALVAEQPQLDGLLELTPTTAGMHLVALLAPKLKRRMSDREAADRARRAGIATSALADYCTLTPTASGLILGFAGFPEADLQSAADRLAKALA
ncbi:MAG: PLP-dependent aminotransferase family protein [Hyphomicrobiaceae bacterium]